MSKVQQYKGTEFMGLSTPGQVRVDGRTLRHAGTDLKLSPKELNSLIETRNKAVMDWMKKESPETFAVFKEVDTPVNCDAFNFGGFGGMGPGTRYAVVDKNYL